MVGAFRAKKFSDALASKASDSLRMDEQNVIEAFTTVSTEIEQLKKHVDASRIASIKDKVVANVETVAIQTTKLLALATSRKNHRSVQCEGTKDMLSFRMEGEACRLIASDCGTDVYRQEASSSTIVCGNFSEIKSLIRTIKLPLVEKIPPYRSWIFLDRNQRMAEDESVVGRRRIYYDQCGSEALICSDSEEETTELEEERHNFTESEDLILWKILHEHGQKQVVVDALKKYIKVTDSEIKSRYESLKERCSEEYIKNNDMDANRKVLLSTSLSAALDSFDNLFCRRCLVFDCRLHGCSQGLIIPSEKLHLSIELEEVGTPCGSQCYLLGKKDVQGKYVVEHDTSLRKENFANLRSTEDTSPSFETGGLKVVIPEQDQGELHLGENMEVRQADKKSEDKIRDTYVDLEKVTSDEKGDDHLEEAFTHASLPDIDVGKQPCNVDKKLFETKQCSYGWNLMERELYLKGVEIFGKNSCLIARNLLSGLKTCLEVSKYMFDEGSAENLSSNMLKFSSLEEVEKVDIDYMETEPSRTRFWRRRGRSRKLKYTWKSTGHPVIRKRMADGKQQSCKQYSPCGCQPVCGKLCPCLHSGTCCEKYCGCPKSCKNRFRGCHCAKSHCRSRQCPCFAAGRECDPDVCRNCWVSCGDGTLGSPPTRGDTYQCGNMNLLLKQQQRILLGKSDVAGWGAFLKNPVNKNDYLGEYTGELISHKEADKRGKIYDRANSSFLFDLNDQFVLDAYRKGDKLKFANHSSNPNCYAKVMMVAGDHRVGIFAKEHIDVGEELFYDYRYEPDRAPDWARKPEGSNSKKDDTVASHGRAKKVA